MKSFPYNRKIVSPPTSGINWHDFIVQATVKALYTGRRMLEMSKRKRRSEGVMERRSDGVVERWTGGVIT